MINENLHIEATEESPEILLYRAGQEIRIIGCSYPEDGPKYYKPVLEWLENYEEYPFKG